MRKRWCYFAAAVLCAAFTLVSCSGHFPAASVKGDGQSISPFADICWESPDGSTLILSDSGFGKMGAVPLSWAKNGSTIKTNFFPGASVGNETVLSELIYNGLPMLYSDGRKYVIKDFLREKETYNTDEAAEQPEESVPTAEELIALEGQAAADMCFGFIGSNYKYGGKTPETGFDCSGLVYYIYEQLGYRLERVANAQSKQGVLIPKEEVQPGDILCFGAPDYCSHVGIYLGQGCYIHAMGSEYGVVLTSLDDAYIKRPKYEVRRIAGCDWLKGENIDAALAAGLPAPTPPPEQAE